VKELRISEDLVLPLKTVTEKLAWLGRTGSGKTYGAMKLAELMLAAGAQVGAIDPVGVWRALRVPAKKGGTSFEVVVFGGLYGDLPLEPTAGVLIADLVCDRGFSFVLDVSQFIPSEQQRFVHAFADRFFHRKKAAPGAVHLFMEECQEFIPENPSGLEAMTLGVMQRLWKLGRNFGIGGSLISQRPQEIAKKALNMSGTLSGSSRG
jgi:DNA helicase HerA-like ATPase